MRIIRFKRDCGSVLMITLVVGGIIGFTLASYFTLINSQNRATLRSTSWNSAMASAEAGIEEALTHLNVNCLSNPITARTVNWTADGWTQVSSSPAAYERRRWLGNGPSKVWYSITLTNTGNRICDFTVVAGSPVPLALAQNQYGPLLAQVTTVGSENRPVYTARRVLVKAKVQHMFPMGLVAKGMIDMNGNNVSVDSFDSRSNQFSTAGLYDPAKRKDGGSVGTNMGLTNSLTVGNANIYGTASTGPGGSVAVGSGGGVGTFQYQSTNSGAIEPGKFSDDMNVDFPDVESPVGTTSGVIPPLLNERVVITNVVQTTNVVAGITNIGYSTNVIDERYDYVFDDGDYRVLDIVGKVLVRGNARVEVTGTINLTGGTDIIRIMTNANLAIYMKGANATFAGQGVANMAGNATNFAYYGLSGNTKIDLKGNAAFTGTIYAPSAELHMGGGGANNVDFSGASITGSVKMNGNFNFHYDEALADSGPLKTYLVESWREVAPPTAAAISYFLPP